MAPPVYSTQFIAALLAADASAIYTVPDGFVIVVRDISGVIFPGPTSGTNIEVDCGEFAIFSAEAPPSCTVTFHWEGRVVMPAGQHLQAFNQFGTGSAEVAIVISGYLLTAP